MAQPVFTGVSPSGAIEGGRATLVGEFGSADAPSDVRVEGRPARTVFASSNRLSFIVPSGIAEGRIGAIAINDFLIENASIELGVAIATGLHQVDNPVIDR